MAFRCGSKPLRDLEYTLGKDALLTVITNYLILWRGRLIIQGQARERDGER